MWTWSPSLRSAASRQTTGLDWVAQRSAAAWYVAIMARLDGWRRQTLSQASGSCWRAGRAAGPARARAARRPAPGPAASTRAHRARRNDRVRRTRFTVENLGARFPRLWRMPRTYFIRTFGCQMNEHDSERLAGLLVADGLAPAATMEDADVVVLNTCCIRENADQRLYGTLGRLKELVDAKPGLQIAVGGCLAQKDRERIQEKVGWVDVVFGTHNLTSAPGLLRRARDRGPGHGDPRRAGARVGHQPAARSRRGARAALCGVGQHPDRVRQLLRLLHRAVGARSRGRAAPSTTSWPRWSCWPAVA